MDDGVIAKACPAVDTTKQCHRFGLTVRLSDDHRWCRPEKRV